jgi:Permuted papain-like amidase enzyme, YaeF/YiiX, C92 family
MQKKWIVLLSILAIGVGYYYYHSYQLHTSSQNRKGNSNNKIKILEASKQLQNGDIVFRRGADGISDLFISMNQKDKRYSHCGIYLVSDSNGFIYHSIGGEDNPDEKIRKEKMESFVETKTNLGFGIYRFAFTSNQLHNLDSIVKLWHAQKRTFDMDFSLSNDERKLYCVEFVVKAIENATQDSIHFSRSKIATKNYEYVAPDDVLLNKNIRKVVEVVYQ